MASITRARLERSLFIATPNTIHYRSQLGNRTLFQCDTVDGIANARVSRDNSSLLAVADSQVVILHDVARGKDSVYRLKNEEVWRTMYCTPQLNFNDLAGRPASSPLFSRLSHSILHNNTEFFGSSVFDRNGRITATAAAAPLATECNRGVQRWKHTIVGFAYTPRDIHTRQTIER